MTLPDIKPNNIKAYLDKDEIVLETIAQVMKDFGMFGLEIHFSGKLENAYHELHQQLEIQLRDLLDNRSELLMSVLYQVDINQKDIVQTLAENPEFDQAGAIAHQVIFRDLKKVLFRRYFKMKK